MLKNSFTPRISFLKIRLFFSATKAVTRKCNKKPRQKCNLIYNLIIISVAKQKNTVCLCVQYSTHKVKVIRVGSVYMQILHK